MFQFVIYPGCQVVRHKIVVCAQIRITSGEIWGSDFDIIPCIYFGFILFTKHLHRCCHFSHVFITRAYKLNHPTLKSNKRLSTLWVESSAGTNFRDFPNSLVFRESLCPRNRSVQAIHDSSYIFLNSRYFLKI